ncbi:ribonuclease J [Candidatus Peregrinibacteria bacterium]|nr:MAG: ribonuclease J [Candidatus Peregrinibacteria bacterium]
MMNRFFQKKPKPPQSFRGKKPPLEKQGGHPNVSQENREIQPNEKKGVLRAYILGGLNEVGKNCLALECNGDIIVVDVGMAFPDDEMLGVDFVIPDTTFLERNKKRIRGFVITHGHLDHIGALQHVLPKVGFPPLIMTKLTEGLVRKRLEEHGVNNQTTIHVVDPYKDTFQLGCFALEFFPVNHSIPDCMGVYGKTPAGTFVHTGDFKFDFTPADGNPAEVGRMAEIGKAGVDVLFCESTNAPKAGFCISEKVIAENLHEVVRNAQGRIILASFSSLVSRIQQVVHFANKYNRKVFISGRSMQNTLEIAAQLGFFKVPKGSIRRLGPAADELPANQVLILTTGSQGEPRSALTRIGHGTHPQITVQRGDTIVFSSSPIPGNERGVYSSINNLIRLGARVITNNTMDIHVSGHGHSGDIKLMHSLMRPKVIVPIHGEMFMREAHRDIAIDLGYPPEQIPLLENGDILEYENGSVRKSKSKIPAELILIDGLGMGDVGTKVMEERKIMANGGTLVVVLKVMAKSKRLVGDPDILSRGFIYMRESKEILSEAQQQAKKSYEIALREDAEVKRNDLKKAVQRSLSTLIYKRIQREPMIIPVIVEV